MEGKLKEDMIVEGEIVGIISALSPLVYAALLATVNSELVDLIKRPLVQKFPTFDFWFFVYINMITGFAIGWFAEVNMFIGIIPSENVGRILSSLLIGGGSSLIYKIFKRD